MSSTGSSWDGKVAIVTGSSRGIGRVIALTLAGKGVKVVVNYTGSSQVDEDIPALEVAQFIHDQGGEAFAVRADVSQRKEVARLLEETMAAYCHVNILVNNAGITLHRSLIETTDEEWNRVFDTNLRGSFLCSQLVAQQLIRQGSGGRIINISSEVATHAITHRCAYSSSKAAVEAFTRCCALELGPYGITVNAVAPGATRTSINPHFADPLFVEALEKTIPLGKIAEPEEIAAVATFLASDAAGHINGEVIHVDGGHIAGRFDPTWKDVSGASSGVGTI